MKKIVVCEFSFSFFLLIILKTELCFIFREKNTFLKNLWERKDWWQSRRRKRTRKIGRERTPTKNMTFERVNLNRIPVWRTILLHGFIFYSVFVLFFLLSLVFLSFYRKTLSKLVVFVNCNSRIVAMTSSAQRDTNSKRER